MHAIPDICHKFCLELARVVAQSYSKFVLRVNYGQYATTFFAVLVKMPSSRDHRMIFKINTSITNDPEMNVS